MASLANLVDFYTAKLVAGKISHPRFDVECLIADILGCSRLEIYLKNIELTDIQQNQLKNMVDRRLSHEPLQYIIGTVNFCGLFLKVTPDVLIPRFETEELIEIICLRNDNYRSILDLGTGSGAIAIALAKKFPMAKITACDISTKALEIAKNNAQWNEADINFIQSNWFENMQGSFDLIVSNPPYLSESDFQIIDEEIRKFEPKVALVGGHDGLESIRHIIKHAKKFLNTNGTLAIEIGEGQGTDIQKISENFFKSCEIIKDLSGRERFSILS